MTIPHVDVHAQYAPLIPELKDAFARTLETGRFIFGPEVEAFEREAAEKLGTAETVSCANGTDAIVLVLDAMGIGPGDEVICPAFTFYATAEAIARRGATPVFADIDPVTLNLDPDAAAAAVTDRTTAVLPVHIFGYPADIPAFERLGLPIVEDACEALGAVHADGVAVGARGHPAVFGFYANKQLTTGEGGIVTMGDAAMKQRIDSERNQGRAPDMGWLDHDRLGFNYRLSDVASAIGLAQLDRLDGMLAERARVAARYGEALAGLEGLGLPCPDTEGNVRGWFVYVVQVPHGHDRDDVLRALREHGIPSKPYMPAIHLMTYYRETFGHREGEFPVCEDIAARSLALPFFPGMTDGQVERVATALARVLGRTA
jgi:perosamine synthetase